MEEVGDDAVEGVVLPLTQDTLLDAELDALLSGIDEVLARIYVLLLEQDVGELGRGDV